MPGKRYRDHVCEQGFFVERVTRIELALSAWEADVLPLNYTRAEGHENAGTRCGPAARPDIVPESGSPGIARMASA